MPRSTLEDAEREYAIWLNALRIIATMRIAIQRAEALQAAKWQPDK
jgi:hypothetical protein